MGIRINRSIRWHYWALTLICLGCIVSVTAWLVSVPSLSGAHTKITSSTTTLTKISTTRRSGRVHNNVNNPAFILLAAKKAEISPEGKGESNKEESSLRGKFRIFSSDKQNSDDDDDDDDDEKEDSPGFFRSIMKRLGDRKEAKKAKKQAELEEKLTAILDMEASDSRLFDISSFNTSSITSALSSVESKLRAARDDLRSVRTARESPSAEEQRLEELRRRAAAERERRLQAQRVSDVSKKSSGSTNKEAEKLDETTISKESPQKKNVYTDDMDDESKRSNPLSVAQKFFSSYLEKQDEEWIPVAPKTRISPGEIVPITAAGLDLLLVASKDGSALHCIANSCPHLGTPLETGMLERLPIEPSSDQPPFMETSAELQETDIASLLAQDGCEDCIVCPLHRTAFALKSGEVRGEWCPYPPVIGKVMGTVKGKATLPVFDVRTKGKNIEVRLNTPFKM